ncbi:MAG TPA: alpha/beta hydrolase [Acidimicrobiales bacterium]|nr:alpha/beta hydrolase [Acidimicrobiales bacterium]
MTTTARVTVEEGVVFGQGGGRDLLCDVYVPPEEKRNGAAILLLHGGSWIAGDRTQLRGYGILLGREGYLCVASEYRLLPEANWPAQIHDAKAALRWLRKNAAMWGVDPDRIAVEGNSAGGHLALLLAGTQGLEEFAGETDDGVSDAVKAVMAVYPPTVLTETTRATSEGRQLLIAMFGEGAAGEAVAELASPITHAKPGFPPTLLISGTNDIVVPHESSVRMYEALAAAGVHVDLHLIAEQPHAFDMQPAFGRLNVQEMLLFLSRYV